MPDGQADVFDARIPGLDCPTIRHAGLMAWVKEIAALTRPDRVRWCDGSQAEWDELTAQMVAAGTLKPLNPAKRPNSFYAASDPARRRPGREPHLHLLARTRRTPDRPTTGASPRACAPS